MEGWCILLSKARLGCIGRRIGYNGCFGIHVAVMIWKSAYYLSPSERSIVVDIIRAIRITYVNLDLDLDKMMYTSVIQNKLILN
jgi:hypothetical protein